MTNDGKIGDGVIREWKRSIRERQRLRDEFDRTRTWPRDPAPHNTVEFMWDMFREKMAVPISATEEERSRRLEGTRGKSHPENHDLRNQILAEPDRDDLRYAYAAWMRQQTPISSDSPQHMAWFIETLTRIAEAFRQDPKTNLDPIMSVGDYHPTLGRLRAGVAPGYGEYETSLVDHFTAGHMFYRGFIEHFAVKAKHLLPFADLFYAMAPLRHLTLTYCPPVAAELWASPHLARIRTLELPNRMMTNHHTRLNDLTDLDVQALADSPHLAGLAYLNLEDNADLTITAFDHLALSPHLPSLSLVSLPVFYYRRQYVDAGDYQRFLEVHRPDTWRDALEARHGYLPWLHAEDHYGTPLPDREAVAMHPVGKPGFRPDLDARRRARLPAAVDLALTACLTPDGALRDRTLLVPLPTGRLLATLERAEPDPDLPTLRARVTLTIQQLGAPIPAYDFATGKNLDLRPRATATLGVRIPRS